MYYSIK